MSSGKRNAPIWVKVFVPLHVFAILAWSLPQLPRPVLNGSIPPYGTDHILLANEKHVKTFPPLRAYLTATGFWQYWDMFSPDPSRTDYWCDAIVVRQNGDEEKYQYPRMYLLSIPQKYLMERYRKFYERAHADEFSYLFAPFAKCIARKLDTQPGNRPVKVRLRRHFQNIPRMGEPVPEKYEMAEYWIQKITPADLDMPETGVRR